MNTPPIDPRIPDSALGISQTSVSPGHSALDHRSRQQTDSDAERFEKAFEEGSPGENEAEAKNTQPGSGGPGDHILNSFLGHLAGPAGQPLSENPASPLTGLAGEVAERILVSEPGQEPEIRIQLKDSVLAGTEICIRRQNGSWLIECTTVSADSARLLLAEKESFQDSLRRRLNDDGVTVTVEQQDQTSGESHDGRSSQYGTFNDPENQNS